MTESNHICGFVASSTVLSSFDGMGAYLNNSYIKSI